MTRSSSIPRSPSQSTFERLCELYDHAENASKSDTQAQAALGDYFNSQPQEQRLAKGRGLLNRVKNLQEPAQHMGNAVAHSVVTSLTQVAPHCAQARLLIDRLCIERDVQRLQAQLERGFGALGSSLREAAAQARLNPDLMAVLRASAVLDEAVVAWAEQLSPEQISSCLAAYTESISNLSDRMHDLLQELKRVHVAVGPGAEVLPLSRDEQADYKALLDWARVVHPGFAACLRRLASVPTPVQERASAARIQAFVSLAKRAALQLSHAAFDPRDMATLRAFRQQPVWQQMAPLVRTLEIKSQLALMHVTANLIALLTHLTMARGTPLPEDALAPRVFKDASAAPLGGANNMEGMPFADAE